MQSRSHLHEVGTRSFGINYGSISFGSFSGHVAFCAVTIRETRFSDDQFLRAMRLRLGIPQFGPWMQCQLKCAKDDTLCNHRLDTFGYHAISCRSGSNGGFEWISPLHFSVFRKSLAILIFWNRVFSENGGKRSADPSSRRRDVKIGKNWSCVRPKWRENRGQQNFQREIPGDRAYP